MTEQDESRIKTNLNSEQSIKIRRITKQKKSLQLLRKQRDGVIGFVEEEMNKLRYEIENLIEKLDLVTNSVEELVNLNDEIYEIEINSDE